MKIKSQLRALVILCLVGLLNSCQLPRSVSTNTRPTLRSEFPTADAPALSRPPKARPALLPSSDEAWLVEMLIQRIELSTARAMLEQSPQPPEKSQAELIALTEAASRAGLSADFSRRLFASLFAASSTHFKERLSHPAPAVPLPSQVASISNQLDTVDQEIIATLLRLRTPPGGPAFEKFAQRQFRLRGLSRKTFLLALRPFDPARYSLPASR